MDRREPEPAPTTGSAACEERWSGNRAVPVGVSRHHAGRVPRRPAVAGPDSRRHGRRVPDRDRQPAPPVASESCLGHPHATDTLQRRPVAPRPSSGRIHARADGPRAVRRRVDRHARIRAADRGRGRRGNRGLHRRRRVPFTPEERRRRSPRDRLLRDRQCRPGAGDDAREDGRAPGIHRCGGAEADGPGPRAGRGPGRRSQRADRPAAGLRPVAARFRRAGRCLAHAVSHRFGVEALRGGGGAAIGGRGDARSAAGYP